VIERQPGKRSASASGTWLERLGGTLLLSYVLGGAAIADGVPPPEDSVPIDAQGVNLSTGALNVTVAPLSIGPRDAGLAYYRYYDTSAGWRDNMDGSVNSGTYASGLPWYRATIFGRAITFRVFQPSTPDRLDRGQVAPLAFINQQRTGESLVQTSSGYQLQLRDGAIAVYANSLAGTYPTQANRARITSIAYPNGETITFTYDSIDAYTKRLRSVNTNRGYQLKFDYQDNNPSVGGRVLARVTAINQAIDYCDPLATPCTGLGQTWPNVTFTTSGEVTSVVDALGRTSQYAFASGLLVNVQTPASAARSFAYDTSRRVVSVANGPARSTYAYVDTGALRTTTVTDPLGHARVYTSAPSSSLILSDTDPLGHTTSYLYESGSSRVIRVTHPEGNYEMYAYDARGNTLQRIATPKPGSELASQTITATYPSSNCTRATCNLPTAVVDAGGNQTDYTYDPTHGGLLSITRPAPVAGAVRPQQRYTYAPKYAFYKNGAGAIVQSPVPIQMLTGTSQCASNTSCSGTAEEIRTALDYGAAGVANNLLLTAEASGSGNGTLWAQLTRTYDRVGNLVAIDGPLPGSADTERFRYDRARQLIGQVAPASTGAPAHRALRYSYDAGGRVTLAERGTVAGQTDADWPGFASLLQFSIGYDAIGRLVAVIASTEGAPQRVTQYSYDDANRLDCVARRAASIALPASACTLGADGQDRISRHIYDAANQRLQVVSGYGTPTTIEEATWTYTPNGRQATVRDPGGNVTAYEYDGFDRLAKIAFPAAAGDGPSANDYLQFSYDADSRVVARRLRDGSMATATFDALGRLTASVIATPAATTTYAYDNLDRLTQVATSTTLTFAYDALDRRTSETSALGTVWSQYDLAGRRTQLTWPDGFFVNFDYDLLGNVIAVRELGATGGAGALARFVYDDLGRRAQTLRGNGVTTNYAYDAATNLSSIVHDLPGAADDLAVGLTHNAFGQVLTQSLSNDAYEWTPPAAGTVAAGVNGLNQLVSLGAATLDYDSRGNLTADGRANFSFDASNRLVASSNGVTLDYDPIGRMSRVTRNAATSFLYDGVNLIGEYDGAGGMRRYVPGAALDEPVVWYEGSGLGDKRWLLQDRLSSVVGVTDAGGAGVAKQSYGPFGEPGPGDVGRFQYTGQLWIPEVGLNLHRARFYSPNLARFVQSDPTLYDDGLNLYAYVHNDPINFWDPSGLQHDTSQGSHGGADDDVVITGRRRPSGPVIFRALRQRQSGSTSGANRGAGNRGGGRPNNAAPPAVDPLVGAFDFLSVVIADAIVAALNSGSTVANSTAGTLGDIASGALAGAAAVAEGLAGLANGIPGAPGNAAPGAVGNAAGSISSPFNVGGPAGNSQSNSGAQNYTGPSAGNSSSAVGQAPGRQAGNSPANGVASTAPQGGNVPAW